MSAKRSLSQNFLVDPDLQRKIVEALGAGPGDEVLEVGPGHGELTRHLLGRAARVVVVEKDDALAAELAERWGGRNEVRVVHGDALEVDLSGLVRPPYRVLSNVPYGITSPLLFRFLDLSPSPARIVVTVQKEVGERVVAEPGGKVYGSLSVGVQARARASLAFGVGRGAFRPVPDVDSVTLVIEPDADRIRALPEPALRDLTRAAFGRRRKQLQTILRKAPEYGLDREEAEALCREVGVEPRVRPEKLAPATFVELARRLGAGAGPGA
ncbi:MAG TPA: 16S rRNA (adenine(1518)-N(6)/adenine(1519)-N(6))-dimethyltransferase RsmA [Gemmatimonadota bacterium]|nr:16S rRNA (adenine(1518)-N(6)/adenine(1519)-N(6))-dimethyltransferase RsmA [Gemmatimonadota bacterium]